VERCRRRRIHARRADLRRRPRDLLRAVFRPAARCNRLDCDTVRVADSRFGGERLRLQRGQPGPLLAAPDRRPPRHFAGRLPPRRHDQGPVQLRAAELPADAAAAPRRVRAGALGAQFEAGCLARSIVQPARVDPAARAIEPAIQRARCAVLGCLSDRSRQPLQPVRRTGRLRPPPSGRGRLALLSPDRRHAPPAPRRRWRVRAVGTRLPLERRRDPDALGHGGIHRAVRRQPQARAGARSFVPRRRGNGALRHAAGARRRLRAARLLRAARIDHPADARLHRPVREQSVARHHAQLRRARQRQRSGRVAGWRRRFRRRARIPA